MSSILGISAFYHDSAACILINGKIVAAAQEERFTRIKHDSNYPHNSINFVLNYAKLKLSEVDKIIFFEKPFLKFERLLETYLAFAPKGFQSFSKAMPVWLRDKLFQKKMLMDELKRHDKTFNGREKLRFSEHHLSHAASAFFPSPFEEAIILTADGVGEWATTTVAIGKKNKITMLKEIHFPHSLGLLYSAFTYYTGFKVNSGEYKVMGLAPYGVPRYADLIKNKLININDDVLDLNSIERGSSGRVTKLEIKTGKGNKSIVLVKDDIRRVLNFIPSNLFTINKLNDDLWLLRGGGFGHGVGLSQSGAIEMAKLGFSYEQILNHYYRDAKLEEIEILSQ